MLRVGNCRLEINQVEGAFRKLGHHLVSSSLPTHGHCPYGSRRFIWRITFSHLRSADFVHRSLSKGQLYFSTIPPPCFPCFPCFVLFRLFNLLLSAANLCSSIGEKGTAVDGLVRRRVLISHRENTL